MILVRCGIAATLLTLATTALADPVQHPLTVQSYAMRDGTSASYGYNDQTYNGTRSGNQLSGGTGDLTDGASGMTVGSGSWNWAPYVMWDRVSPVITFDLGRVQRVDAITGHFLAYGGAAVYLPGSASVRFSDDGQTFGAALLSTISTTPLPNDTPVALSLLSAPGSGRYVELTLATAGRWTALSEVTLLQAAPGSNAVPEPASGALALTALAATALVRRRRRRR